MSSNEGLSECPSVAIATSGTYAVWEDNTYGNDEILFTKIPEDFDLAEKDILLIMLSVELNT